MTLINIILMLMSILVGVPTAVFVIEIVLSTIPKKRAEVFPTNEVIPSVAVLVPAHNEAAGIERTIRSILAGMPLEARLVVVADNCTDQTASVARSFDGVEVLERVDLDRRGKGYALDHGFQWLSSNPPEVLIVVDADCQVHGDAISLLAKVCVRTNRPIQAQYLMRGEANSGLKIRFAEFAWMVKNHVRPLGAARIGAPCQLTGSGMAFPWRLLARVPMANGSIVEDMKLGVEFAALGLAPQFSPGSLVTSEFPTSKSAITAQRRRWEHGHLAMLATAGPRLAIAAARLRDLEALALLADLLVPPLALLVLMQMGLLLMGVGAAALGGGRAWLDVAVVLLFLLSSAVLMAWYTHGRKILSFLDLLKVPAYIVWKIPLYAALVFHRQTQWVRTKRDAE